MKAIVLSTLSGWLARIFAIALNVVGIPLALEHLGASRFGLLLVILSIGSWIGFANLGMGRVISNIVARQRRSSSRFAVEAVSTGAALAAIINILLFVAGTALFFLFMSFTTPSALIADNYQEFTISIVSLFFALCLWFFLSVFEGIDAGRHQLHRLYLFQLASYVIALAVLLLVFPDHPSIWFATYLLNLSFLLGSVFHAFDVARRNRGLFSAAQRWRPQIIRLLLLSSMDFTIISLGTGVLYQLATGLFGFVWGPETVIDLGVFMRLMQSYGGLVIAFTYPLSNIVASKLRMRDEASALRTVRLSGAVMIACATFGAVLFLMVGDAVLSYWLRSPVDLGEVFTINASILIVLAPMHFFLAALLIGAALVKQVARVHIAEAAAFVVIASLLFGRLQEGGVLLAMNVVLGVGCVLMVRRLRRHPVLRELVTLRAQRVATAV